MNIDFKELLTTVANEPLGMHIDSAHEFLQMCATRDQSVGKFREIDARRYVGQVSETGLYYQYGSTAIIPIVGPLNRRRSYYLDSYEMIEARVTAAADDAQISRIILDIDSPGGLASGMSSCADVVSEANDRKQVTAVVYGWAASAAYGLASQASEIVIDQTGEVGSIGVVQMHISMQKALEEAGIEVNLLTNVESDLKTLGNRFENLTADARARILADLQGYYADFKSTVRSGRPSLSNEQVDAFRGDMFTGEDAVNRGLADRVGTLLDELQVPRNQPGSSGATGATTMSNPNPAPGANPALPEPSGATPTTPATPAATPAPQAIDQKARISAILNSEEAQGREDLAKHYAFDTDDDAAKAIAAMAAAPKAVPAAATPSAPTPTTPGAEAGTPSLPTASVDDAGMQVEAPAPKQKPSEARKSTAEIYDSYNKQMKGA